MILYLLRKILYTFLVVFGVATLIFALFNLIPGDPARMVLGQRTDSLSIQAARSDLGLDLPVWKQYVKYINDISPISFHELNDKSSFLYYNPEIYGGGIKVASVGNGVAIFLKVPYLRRSYQSRQPVSVIISNTLPNTFYLALAAIVFATIFGISMGVLAAIFKDTFWDRLLLVNSALGMALPSFFAAILIGWLFAIVLGKFTGLNLTGNLWEVDDLGEGVHLRLQNLILPALTLGLRPLGVITQLMRSSLLETLSQDYIRTAKAKGLNKRALIFRHALRNSLNPVVTSISGWFASMMAGVIFVEYIFSWKGLGYVMVNALNSYDVPLVVGCVLTIAVIFSLVNLLVDIIYGILDPRVRLG
ncbi:MAG: peptide/nickel transport system permease protein [Tenuifilum sp.]|jgi:peptide/nickel transport system permease protein|uniref:ABC transporter permease n=1 Tax=Tenuifilum sp. TaxID=2760880 RepID=UPI0024AC7DBE|nr:ABC transporter permease [Tenuifilum sp.]MDI3526872.1 peptide/nickel transport system permease protein [Tenuifilum sp.]